MSAKWTYPAVRKGKQTGDTNRRPTRNDVAALAGVSTAVVSYVMNDGPRKVAPATRQRVLDAVRELDYQPNDAARSLRTQSTHTIALISHALQSSHFGTLTTSITERLAEQSYVATVSTLDDNSDPTPPVVQRLIAKRVDGVALSAQVASPELLTLLRQEGVPAIVIGARVADATSVLVEPATIRQVAAEHLHALGHERIALLHRQTSADQPTFPSDMTIETNDTIEAGIEAANHLIGLDQRPTAVIVESELVALGAIDALKRSGLAIPDDISVIGLDDLDLGRHLTPSLTAVPSLGPEVGSAAAQVLLQKISGEPTPDVTEVVPVVIERESTAPASP